MELTLNMSYRGNLAMLSGKKPLILWTHKDIVHQIISIKLNNKNSPRINFNELWNISFQTLSQYLLITNEWHHVRFKPAWFYHIDTDYVINMTSDDINQMKSLDKLSNDITNKPKWTRFKISKWKISTTHHEYCDTQLVYGVLYNNTAYFMDGRKINIEKDYCIPDKIYMKTPKNRKKDYDAIRKGMRIHDIYC